MFYNMRVLSLIFLLLGSASSFEAETCPNEDEISPCICYEDDDSGDIFVSCDDEDLNLAKLKQSMNAFSGKKNVDLVIMDFPLGTVPSNFFYGIEIKRLEISHCDLDSLSDYGRPSLFGLEDSLQELIIMSSFTEENVPARVQLGHMRKLKEVDLSYNAITEVGNDWFDRGPASLEYLLISNNGIEKVGDRAFANLINLKQLSFDGNRFSPIRRSMLPYPAARLQSLELDNNALTSIPEDLFTNMPALGLVSLRNDGILRLDQRTWYPVWQHIEQIYLEGNPIGCDSSIDWILAIKRVPIIYGKCHSPREVEDEEIQEYIDKRTLINN